MSGWNLAEIWERIADKFPDAPAQIQGWYFNTRRPKFSDVRVREALVSAFDFEWTNRNLFFSQYVRTQSYFSNSELASTGSPQPAGSSCRCCPGCRRSPGWGRWLPTS